MAEQDWIKCGIPVVEWAKGEIIADVKAGRVPLTVASFSRIATPSLNGTAKAHKAVGDTKRSRAAVQAVRWAKWYTLTAIVLSAGLNGYAAAVEAPSWAGKAVVTVRGIQIDGDKITWYWEEPQPAVTQHRSNCAERVTAELGEQRHTSGGAVYQLERIDGASRHVRRINGGIARLERWHASQWEEGIPLVGGDTSKYPHFGAFVPRT